MTTSMARQQLLAVESTCGSLLNDLQQIWEEVGESDQEKDQTLLELEQECLEVYRRKIDEANRSRAHLHRTIAEIHVEIAALASALGVCPPIPQEKRGISLKEQLLRLTPLLEDLTQKKEDRVRQFQDIKGQIQRIQSEISESSQAATNFEANEHDLTQRRWDELLEQLQVLIKEKDDRLYTVLQYVETVHDLCAVLDLDVCETIRKVHPSLDESFRSEGKSISDETMNRLAYTIDTLREEKKRRMQKVQDLGASLIELWNLMDTPIEEQQQFQHVTCNIAAEEHEIVAIGALSRQVIEQAKSEVDRLDQLKASKMKELVLKKRTILEDISRTAHIIPDENTLDIAIASMDSGMVDPRDLLASIEEQIGIVKEEVFSRKDVMERVEKWMAICEEESWLEDYNKDENRFNATTRGAHLNLKRAERARASLSKIPALMESLVTKTTAWEEERGKPFLYDGVRLLTTLEEYNMLRMEKEEERRRQRDHRRLHEQLVNEQETLFGSRASPNGRTPQKKAITGSRLNGGSTTPALITPVRSATPKENHMKVTPAPERNGSSAAKVNNIRVTPASVKRMLMPEHEKVAPPGKRASNVQACGHESEASSWPCAPRQPLSPVSGSNTIRQNTNIDDGTPTKAAFLITKSPLSAMSVGRPSTTTVMDEENAPPPHQHQQLVPQSQVREHSFEERRLAFICSP